MQQMRNKVQLIGRLGSDPEMREFTNGNKLCRMSIATNETYINKEGERVESTQWHNIVAWGKLADRMNKFLSKGREVAIEGKLVSNSYEDKEGVKRYSTEVHVNDFIALGEPKNQAAEAN